MMKSGPKRFLFEAYRTKCRARSVADGRQTGGVSPHVQLIAIYTPSGLFATNLTLFPGRLQLPVALRMDVLLPPANMSFGVV